jgi:hypothetical protein
MEVTTFAAYATTAQQVEAIKAFFEANNVSFKAENSFFSLKKEKEHAIHAKIKLALETGLWLVLDEEEREDFVLGAILEQADTSKIIDADTMKNKIKQRLNATSL